MASRPAGCTRPGPRNRPWPGPSEGSAPKQYPTSIERGAREDEANVSRAQEASGLGRNWTTDIGAPTRLWADRLKPRGAFGQSVGRACEVELLLGVGAAPSSATVVEAGGEAQSLMASRAVQTHRANPRTAHSRHVHAQGGLGRSIDWFLAFFPFHLSNHGAVGRVQPLSDLLVGYAV